MDIIRTWIEGFHQMPINNSESAHPADSDSDPDPGARGFFISFEGAESSGKSTQASLLTSWMKERGYTVLRTREPGGTEVGEKLRSILLGDGEEMVPATEALLFAAARAELVHTVIVPALQRGEVVICDRYIDSSIAYQAFGLGLEEDDVLAINRWALREAIPNLTIVLGKGRELVSSGEIAQPDRIETRGEDFHRRVRMGYAKLARRHPKRIVLVDTGSGVEETAAKIKEIVMARLVVGRQTSKE
ncbi:MAG: dTMP kinase [Bacillota bacterium]